MAATEEQVAPGLWVVINAAKRLQETVIAVARVVAVLQVQGVPAAARPEAAVEAVVAAEAAAADVDRKSMSL